MKGQVTELPQQGSGRKARISKKKKPSDQLTDETVNELFRKIA